MPRLLVRPERYQERVTDFRWHESLPIALTHDLADARLLLADLTYVVLSAPTSWLAARTPVTKAMITWTAITDTHPVPCVAAIMEYGGFRLIPLYADVLDSLGWRETDS